MTVANTLIKTKKTLMFMGLSSVIHIGKQFNFTMQTDKMALAGLFNYNSVIIMFIILRISFSYDIMFLYDLSGKCTDLRVS